MKFLSIFFLFFSSVSFTSASEKCIEVCRMGSPDCIMFGLEMKKATQPLLDFTRSAQLIGEGIVGNICNRDTLLTGDLISNSGTECNFEFAEFNTITEVPHLVQGYREKTSLGVYQVVFDSVNTFKSATYDGDGSLVFGGKIASIVPFVESDGTSAVVWETAAGQCYYQIEKF